MTDQHRPRNPVDQYPAPDRERQPELEYPGLTSDMVSAPDHGEQTYRGSGRLEGRRALITGADSGIGRAVAIAFAREGADVVLSYLESEEDDARDTVRWIEDAGRRAVAVPGDIRAEEHCRHLVDTAVRELGGLDILVNNAAFQMVQMNGIADITTEQFDRVLKTNLYALFWLCKFGVGVMEPGSTIINTSSIQGTSPSPELLDYATTKAGIVDFTKGLAADVAKRGIRVNAVAPGPIWTPLIPATMPREKFESFGDDVPLGRPGQPAELAPAYVFLASQESSYITGEVIAVTGGKPFS
ncbi:SDR family oxidoreductase [Rhodococcus aetherivorans]|uniref:SDR family oxidoreductase n=1 Tax=Rhodococcus aetherivorans TaxID=191292 RepID=A0AA46SAY2_9NOCA|nr:MULTISPECIES: glucose 1-dehydrogenase [Rhodococcus]PND50528.1 3-oxoacyl-ACP reductase [Rhodococcus sp. ENV425]USC14202.1 SDR family oxidoreductase [Rhodococcus sp. 11-3]UYF95750.1 SDR family oxidoreductase [Rhodococcus aetherivorans]WKW97510.1 SDR family oxidoreductase [Rhodococcus aetherivorans]CCW14698.1 Dehydrogenases with different specificities (related to short-chain alcohol dehydrogenases [Rhodococcus aetherivorans]